MRILCCHGYKKQLFALEELEVNWHSSVDFVICLYEDVLKCVESDIQEWRSLGIGALILAKKQK